MRRPGIVVLALVVAACTASPPSAVPTAPDAVDERVRVATFEFAESRLLGELYAQSLERAGVAVERIPALASREIVAPAMEAGLVDLVPEYVGTLLSFVTRPAPPGDGLESALERLREEMAGRGMRVLDPAAAENSNGVAVSRDLADRMDLRTISDLVPVASRLRFGGPAECPERPLCLRGLRTRYGLSFSSFTALDASGPLTLAAILGAEVDVATVFTTSAIASHAELLVLEDDRDLQPAENVVPVVREDVADRLGDRLVDPLDAVTRTLSTGVLSDLVARVEEGPTDPADVARAWLDRNGL